MVAVVEDAGLDAVEFLVVLGAGFAADVVVEAGGGHEVALVGGIEKHFPRVRFAAESGDRGDARAGFFHALLAVEPFVADDRELEFAHEILEDVFGHVGLEDPHGAIDAVHGGRALAFVAVFGFLLLAPSGGLVVVLPDAVVEIAGEAADDGFVAGVGEAEAAGGKTTEVFIG